MTNQSGNDVIASAFVDIHASVKFGSNFQCGRFVVIDENVVIGDDVVLGDFVKIEADCVVGNHVELGDYVKLMSKTVMKDHISFDDYCNTSGYCEIGNYVVVKRQTMIGQSTIVKDNVWIGSNVTTNRLKYPVMDNAIETEEGVVIESRCVLGSKSLILAGVTMREGSWLSTGGVLTKTTEPGFIYVGNPARKLREVPPERAIPALK
jgi:UDP-2-acetamido-3-amino-2,3-dideoxy-glucuronate N-acetyltransferase